MTPHSSISAKTIRTLFLDFFRNKQHHIVSSAPIVVKNDPTLFFINAGMNPFKDYFLGNKIASQKRIADTQKCLRVSGKHNDLEEVGRDHYHHTMFEMLGNWSFGDYFKEYAIAWAWEFLIEVCNLPKERMYATIFEGSPEENVSKDNEAFDYWRRYLPESHILTGNKKDNFWEMGDTGPCGPCSEIHLDLRSDEDRKKTDGALLVNKDHPDVIEIWNLVFIQFERKQDSSLVQLSENFVDTGMGLERLVRAVNRTSSNYDSDLFMPIIQKVEQLTNKKYTASNNMKDVAFRVLADHIRAIAFTIADEQLPSNVGAGYIIRRILRRAVRYYYSFLEYKEPLLFQLLDTLSEQMSDVFPELKQTSFLKNIIQEEENIFLNTLSHGIKKFNALVDKNALEKKISGSEAFELYDTYGFPLDLTKMMAAENHVVVDEQAFEQEMQRQKERSRGATQQYFGEWVNFEDGATHFVGYEQVESTSKILKYRAVTQKGKSFFQVILATTPFYAESGGQAGDVGKLFLVNDPSTNLFIFDTIKENDTILHCCELEPSADRWKNKIITAQVDRGIRTQHQQHHSATHLMHAALHHVIGKNVQQKGCSLNHEKIRFDFSYNHALSVEQLKQIEQMVNQKIRQNIAIEISQLPKDEAIKMGAMALFGEKYGDIVRTVVMDKNFSIELCGGTHVRHTGEIGLFKIVAQSSVAAGVRRVEAVAGETAITWLQSQSEEMSKAQAFIKGNTTIIDFIEQQKAELKLCKKEIEELQHKLIQIAAKHLLKEPIQKNSSFSFVCLVPQDIHQAKQLQLLNQAFIKEPMAPDISILIASIQQKVFIHLLKKNAIIPFDLKLFFETHILSRQGSSGGGNSNQITATAEGTALGWQQHMVDVLQNITI